MAQPFESSPDLMPLSTMLMNRAARNGHNPRVVPNGNGYGIVCQDHGELTHLNYDGRTWNAVKAHPHSMH